MEVEQRIKAIEQRVAASALEVQRVTVPESAPRPDSIIHRPIRAIPDEPFPGGGGSEAEQPPEMSEEVPDNGEADDDKPDINRVSFEQLRELGLSVTEAARLLASRDARGAYKSLDELNELWGFSRDLVDRLRRRLSLG